MKKRRLKVVDLFCGAGGTSGGVYEAGESLGRKVDLVAVNHWDVAIATHTKNHTHARHLCESLESVRPRQVVPGGYLDLLVASPECTHHSTARGGVPMSEQSRATAWSVLTWAQHLYIRAILIENVPEFLHWGPLGRNGRPIKAKRGETFKAFIESLRSLGYEVDYRVHNAADFGDPTERRRLFIMAKRGRGSVTWPKPLFDEHGRGGLPRWRTFEEHVADWSLPSKSIFNRKKPLATKTLMRIGAGLAHFGGLGITKFLVKLNGTGRHRSTRLPLPTITAGGKRLGLVTLMPYIVPQHSGGKPRVGKPVPGIVASGRGIGVVRPYIIPRNGEREGQSPRFRGTARPLPTVASNAVGGLVQPYIVDANPTLKWGGVKRFRSGKQPLQTVLTRNRMGVVEPWLLAVNHGHSGGSRIRSVKRPLNTVDGSRGMGLARAFLVQFNGTGKIRRVDRPMGTLTTKHRYALVTIGKRKFYLDILFRMLHWRELARAMSFPDSYVFTGTGEQIVKQIGNAVPRKLAAALCREALS